MQANAIEIAKKAKWQVVTLNLAEVNTVKDQAVNAKTDADAAKNQADEAKKNANNVIIAVVSEAKKLASEVLCLANEVQTNADAVKTNTDAIIKAGVVASENDIKAWFREANENMKSVDEKTPKAKERAGFAWEILNMVNDLEIADEMKIDVNIAYDNVTTARKLLEAIPDDLKGQIDNAKNIHNQAVHIVENAKKYVKQLSENNNWENIKQRIDKSDAVKLDGSETLGAIKDHVTITIVQFVTDLNGNSEKNPIFQIGKEQKIVFSHSIEEKKEEIISFFLNDQGLFYEWNTETINKKMDVLDKNEDKIAYRGKLYRILLSKLQIEFEGVSKEIPLWQPAEPMYNENGPYALWEYKEVGISEELPLLLDFEKYECNKEPHKHMRKLIEKGFDIFPGTFTFSPQKLKIGLSEIRFGIIPEESGDIKIDFHRVIDPELIENQEKQPNPEISYADFLGRVY